MKKDFRQAADLFPQTLQISDFEIHEVFLQSEFFDL